jgi:hypothetical protein
MRGTPRAVFTFAHRANAFFTLSEIFSLASYGFGVHLKTDVLIVNGM